MGVGTWILRRAGRALDVWQADNMLEYLKKSHSTSKHRYNVYRCTYCKNEVVRRQREPMHESCGCMAGNHRHGHEVDKKPTPELKCYRKMRERCYSPEANGYEDYGGRGISVCSRWLESFEAFLEDLGPRPSSKHSIERIDVNGNYEPRNCRWATKLEQMRNMRTNRFITIDGRTECLAVWLVELGVAKTTFYRRVNQGLTDREALLRE